MALAFPTAHSHQLLVPPCAAQLAGEAEQPVSARASFWGAGAPLLLPRSRRAQRCKCVAPQANEINKWCDVHLIKRLHTAHLTGGLSERLLCAGATKTVGKTTLMKAYKRMTCTLTGTQERPFSFSAYSYHALRVALWVVQYLCKCLSNKAVL